MIKTVVTEAIISKGYEGADAIKIIQGEKGDIARFRIGTKVYDPKADGNSRWFNLSVKAFNSMCERIKKMQLKDGAYINLSGRLDEENWEDPNTHEKKKAIVLIADEVEYCYAGNNGANKQNTESGGQAAAQQTPAPAQNQAPANTASAQAEGFTGFEAFGGQNAFFG